MRIFLTGGAGFLGRAIMRRPTLFSPDPVRFTVYSRDEVKHAVARREFPDAVYLLGDVVDLDRLELAMAGHDIVIHAGAMKHVPQGEHNVWESVRVNVVGSQNVAVAAKRTGVERVVGISTDKASGPVNVYGMTKQLMERLFQEADNASGTRFNLVRYGNVISSTGSVIPLFRRQAHEGVLTVTNPDMTRFWLSVEEAVGLIADALHERDGGTVLIPRLPSATMASVAHAAADLEVDEADHVLGPLRMEVTGHRFGEKVHESLVSPEEAPYTEWSHGRLMRMYPPTQGARGDYMQEGYSSDDPDEKLNETAMVRLIRASTE